MIHPDKFNLQSNTYARSSMSASTAAMLLSCSLVLGVSGCSTLPKQIEHPVQMAFETPTEHTHLAQIVLPLREKNPQLTGYRVLYDPLEALSARLYLIDKAEETLDLQYYIWDNDKIGALALHSIIRAADRGVKVRLLVDDNNAKKMEGIYLALDQHSNIDVKLYNPYRFRKYRAMDMVLDLKRINRRMHNKSFIADNQIALIGGRNMSNQYYNVSDSYQFSDVDVMLVGSASDEIIHSFDEYWNDDYAYSVKQLVNPQQHHLRYESLKQQLEDHSAEVAVQNYLDLATRSQAIEQWFNHKIQFDWVKAEVVKDSPSKIKDRAPKEELLNFQLLSHLEKPTESVDIISAYFVPEESGADRLKQLANDGVQVRVLTNSYKANDVPLVHAFYAKYRQDLLENDVELYEFLYAPEAEHLNSNTEELSKKAKVSLKGLSRSSLHAKLMALDEKQVFIGSFNFDPRSAYLNSEIGVLLNSPTLAKSVHQTMDANLSKYAYRLVLDAQNNINWRVVNSKGEERVFVKEPKMKWYEKAAMKIISWLPIEGFM
ncbi:phospholipase D family protein [Acinetobacter indicus]|nr:phospholipase D family protein [Acinetobacter indicus]MDM1321582.1 phospholipase D family protein [Acinetobacter indicus]MDM1333249.1 phospholipase D family protein [Acinetobacter indicus]QSG85212.1 phospholipase D family protein [Acinetobacter indicus]